MSDSAMPYGVAGSGMQVGKYRLLHRLASGGMAEVFLATDDGRNLWAVKLMLPHLSDQPEFLGLFLDEARLASLLNHPNVARVKDMGMEDGRLFIAMEYVRGQPLSNLLLLLKERGQELTPVQAAEIVAQSAAGLNAAHVAKGRDGKPLELVHRDVSPQNLLLTDEGLVKVVDFGIAKARNKLVVTQVNTTRGKPWYMSPEQMRGEPLDSRADVFALGAVLFELLAGNRMFDGDVDQVMYRALNEPLPNLATVKPDCPTDLVDLVSKACSYKRDDRQETAWEMEQELRAFVAGAGGAGDLGALIRDFFPPMPVTVGEIEGEEEPPPAPARPAPRSPARPKSSESKPSMGSGRPRGLGYTRPKQDAAPAPTSPAPKAPSARKSTVPDSEPGEPAPKSNHEAVTSRDAGEAFASRPKVSAAPPAAAARAPSAPPVTPVAGKPVPAVLSDPTAPAATGGASSKKATVAVMAVSGIVLVGGGGVFAWKMAAKEDATPALAPQSAPLAPPKPLLAKSDAPVAPAAPTGPTAAVVAPPPDALVTLDLGKAKPGLIRVSASQPGVVVIDGKIGEPTPIELSVTPDHLYTIGFAPLGDARAKFSKKAKVGIGKTAYVFFGGSAKNIFDSEEALRQGIADIGIGKTARGLEEVEYALSLGDNSAAEHELGHYLVTHDSIHSGVFHLESWLRMLKQRSAPADKIAEAQKEVDEAKKKD